MNNQPKYFENLHLLVSAITGTPRIVNIDFKKTNLSDKYKDIPKEEWEAAIYNYFDSFIEGKRQVFITENWSFFIGGNPKDKKQLIKMLEKVIKEVKELGD